MRNFALTQATAAGAVGFSLPDIFANWRARREVARLISCDSTTLADMGLSHDDIMEAMNLPLTQNPRLVLDQRAFLRSHMKTV